MAHFRPCWLLWKPAAMRSVPAFDVHGCEKKAATTHTHRETEDVCWLSHPTSPVGLGIPIKVCLNEWTTTARFYYKRWRVLRHTAGIGLHTLTRWALANSAASHCWSGEGDPGLPPLPIWGLKVVRGHWSNKSCLFSVCVCVWLPWEMGQ